MNAYVDAMRRYFDFKGRSSRAEFWYFTLIVTGVGILAVMIDLTLGYDKDGLMPIATLWMVPHYIPWLAAAVRRLHDIDRTGWWVLIGVIPGGPLVQLVFFCQPSTPGPNRFGSGPVGYAALPVAVAHRQTSTAAGTLNLDQLERLAALRASGAISETEFRQMKADTITASRA